MSEIAREAIHQHYDVVVIGSGFGSLFFIHGLLKKRPVARVLVIEWGELKSHNWQLREMRNSPIAARATYDTPDYKTWNFTIGYGGGTNCWFAQTPRLHPNDFRTHSLYGIGQDWPISYDTLEPYYCDAEEVMSISGPADIASVFPRSRPYPQPPHRMTTPDRLMKAAQSNKHFVLPTARARVPTKTRNVCCDSARCNLCPVDAKFTALNGFTHLLNSQTVEFCFGIRAVHLYRVDHTVKSVTFRSEDGREQSVSGDLFVVGANAIHSPNLLMQSGINHPLTGVGLNEQLGLSFEVLLDGVNNFDGSTITTGINLSAYDGDFRKTHGGASVYFENRFLYGLRKEHGRWRQSLPLTVMVENPAVADNRVFPGRDGVPLIRYVGPSEYGTRGVAAIKAKLPKILSPLPIEDIIFKGVRGAESHLQGTLRMGFSPADSVVDRNLLHHNVRNLIVVGTSLFPNCPPLNPSLTAAALSLWAADQLFA